MESPLVLDMAIHHFDLCRYLTGADPVAVYAHEFNPKGSWYKGDVAASIIFEMTDGIVFTYRGSWCSEGFHTSWNGNWRVIGDRGTLLQEFDQHPRAQRVKAGAEPKFHLSGYGIAGSLNEFLDALDGKVAPQCELRDNIKSLAMVFAAMESARTGQRTPVRWD
jgi:predicted dehydrogenase